MDKAFKFPDKTLLDDCRKRMLAEKSELGKRLVLLEFLTTELAAQGFHPPVIVGGCAVEFYTSGKYMSQDVDILGPREEIIYILKALGFEKDNNDPGSILWSEEVGIVIDWQGAGPQGRVFKVQDEEGHDVLHLLDINDLIIDRLCACKFWKYEESCEWAEILAKIGQEENLLDHGYLCELARREDVEDLLENILKSLGANPYEDR